MSGPPVIPFVDSKKVDDDYTCSGAVDEDVIKKVSEEGYKSILNLRGCGEPGYFDEGEVAKKYNLEFAQSPVLASPTSLNYESVVKAAKVLHDLPKPVYVHCSHGSRAVITKLVHNSLYVKKKTADELLQEASALGFNYGQVWQDVLRSEHQ